MAEARPRPGAGAGEAASRPGGRRRDLPCAGFAVDSTRHALPFLLDFVEAESSTSFHAPQEATRALGESIDYARQGQIALRDPSYKPTVQVVVIATAPPAAPACAVVPAPLQK